MEKVIEVLNQMQADGVFEKFAIGGGIATIYYLEPYQTDDIDVFFLPVFFGKEGLVSLEPIYSYLEKLGYHSVDEGVGIIQIEEWPVQFVPVCESTQEEAVMKAQQARYGETPTLIFTAEHLAAELLRSGRAKDHARVVDLVRSKQVEMKTFRDILNRHGLFDKWKDLASRYGLEV
jgi:hypothetical protein